MLTKFHEGTLVEVPEGQTLWAVQTPSGPLFVVAVDRAAASQAAWRANAKIFGITPAR
jgi:hypothetical protein